MDKVLYGAGVAVIVLISILISAYLVLKLLDFIDCIKERNRSKIYKEALKDVGIYMQDASTWFGQKGNEGIMKSLELYGKYLIDRERPFIDVSSFRDEVFKFNNQQKEKK